MGIFSKKKTNQNKISPIEESPPMNQNKNDDNKIKENTLTGEVTIEKLNVSIYTPKQYRHIKFASVNIKNGHPTVINMMKLNSDEAKTALHFISGLLFAVDGTHVKLSSKVFLVMPKLLKDEVIEQIQNQLIEQSLNPQK